MAKTTTKKRKRKYTKRARRLQVEAVASLITILFVIFLVVKFHTSPEHYKVVIFQEDNSVETIQYYTSFKTAKKEMQRLIDEGAYNPAVVNDDDDILAIRYGVVNFNTKTCGENTSYTLESNGSTGYTNGCYGADGAYLETNDKGNQVRFKQSGAIGWVDRSEVKITNFFDSEQSASINHYTIKDGDIYHIGTTDMSAPSYAISVNLGSNSIGVTQDVLYSYDAHYFYESYVKMIDDYRAGTYANSVNPEQPYYNYYQYLSHRSKTSYVSREINSYIVDYLGYGAKPDSYPPGTYESQLFDEGYSFIDAQNTYGVNALMMFSLAVNESGFGRSQISIEKNNLFGHAAYDNSPNESANGYDSVAASIATHAKIFLSQGYLNPCDQVAEDNMSPKTCLAKGYRYAGGYFGNKASGLNVKYASDPYWGEKAAQYYMLFDRQLGEHDKDRYDIRFLAKQNVNAYSEPSTKANVIYITPSFDSYAVIVAGEVEGSEVDGNTTWYKIQSDAVLNDKRDGVQANPDSYNFKNDVVYIPAAYFQSEKEIS